MAAARMELGSTDVEGHIPASTAPYDSGEQDLGAARELLSRDWIDT
jgi:hypothetical protein